MSKREEQLRRLQEFNRQLGQSDPELHEEALHRASLRVREESARNDPIEDGLVEETIVTRTKRPVLPIRSNDTKLEFAEEADSVIWAKRLTLAKPLLDRAIPAVGRINLSGAPLDWVGTAWVIAEDVIVTNRHVAEEFAARDGDSFRFEAGSAGMISANLDFLQEIDNPEKLVFDLVRPLYIGNRPGPDVAFFQIKPVDASGAGKLASPIHLAAKPRTTPNAAVIGYPAYDSRIPETGLMVRIFGRVYDKKRLAPGAVTAVEENRILHDCSTLGGNSGSAVVDLDTGEVLGLHFSGRFLTTNYAVPAHVVKAILDDVRSGRLPRPGRGFEAPAPSQRAPSVQTAVRPEFGGASASITIPLTVTINVGDPRANIARPKPMAPLRGGDAAQVDETEAVAADYRDRRGYQQQFLGENNPELEVALPTVRRRADEILQFEFDGSTETELRYHHYSVLMNRRRRMCFFSAVNIDGKLAKKSARVRWKWDPRIPKAQQIMHECYGDPPKFSRGHMTRREDPGWGDDAETARRGNEDSMHVTNTTPQMQAFNSPIWLGLEDYALDNAKRDEMKISVFTGPYFADDDPEIYGVQVPRAFWKIIAFVHDETRRLCATGYEMSQEKNLPREEEFVYGQFFSRHLNGATQVPIRRIEARSGLDFGKLASVDPRANDEEGVDRESQTLPLLSFQQIRFV